MSNQQKFEITDNVLYKEYLIRLEANIRYQFGEYLGNNKKHVETFVQQRRNHERGTAAIDSLKEYVDIENKKLLDIGSGWGELMFASLVNGADAYGIEPDTEEFEISHMLLKSYGLNFDRIKKGVGEKIPYPDNHFDLVTCQNVLEHVQDREQTLKEIIRVTKPGGIIWMSVPNYLFPYEGHYRLKWFPLTPKWIGKYILKALGRNPEFLMKHVSYTTYPALMRLWKKNNLEIRNVTEEKILSGEHKSDMYSSKLLTTIILKLKLFPNITWLLKKK